MTQVEIEQLILENGFKLEDKEGHITYEFGIGDIYRISQLLFKKMNYIPCCKSDSEPLKCEHKYGQLKEGVYTCFDCGRKEEW